MSQTIRIVAGALLLAYGSLVFFRAGAVAAGVRSQPSFLMALGLCALAFVLIVVGASIARRTRAEFILKNAMRVVFAVGFLAAGFGIAAILAREYSGPSAADVNGPGGDYFLILRGALSAAALVVSFRNSSSHSAGGPGFRKLPYTEPH